ncbi:MAG: hypothetical protein ACTSRA_11145 [Promethearchaeota archaeon]
MKELNNIDHSKNDELDVRSNQPKATVTPAVADDTRMDVVQPKQDLIKFISRYHEMLGFRVKASNDALEIFKDDDDQKPVKCFVFERSEIARRPDAEFITFNSQQLLKMIKDVKDKGAIAKIIIDTPSWPSTEFQELLYKTRLTLERDVHHEIKYQAVDNDKEAKIDLQKYIKNGRIDVISKKECYFPFIMLLVNIDLESIEKKTIVHKIIVPAASTINLDPQTMKVLSTIVIKQATSNPSAITRRLPQTKNARKLEPVIENIDALLPSIQNEIQNLIDRESYDMIKKLDSWREKELGIINEYYSAMLQEIDHRIELAEERDDQEDVNQFNKMKNDIIAEKKFKIEEMNRVHELQHESMILGAAMIYTPLVIYQSKIVTERHEFDYNFIVNMFENQIILPACKSCGNTPRQISVCDEGHFACDDCFASCTICKKNVCWSCGMKICKTCENVICATHAQECEICKYLENEDRWTCPQHSYRCTECGKTVCGECSTRCAKCGILLCDECKQTCTQCGADLCHEHAILSAADKQIFCNEHAIKCHSCKQTVGVSQLAKLHGPRSPTPTCQACMDANKFYFYIAINDFDAELKYKPSKKERHYERPITVRYGRFKFSVPPSQVSGIKLGFAKNYFILKVKKNLEKYTLIYNRSNNEYRYIYQQSILSKILHYLQGKKQQEPETIEKNKPIITEAGSNKVMNGASLLKKLNELQPKLNQKIENLWFNYQKIAMLLLICGYIGFVAGALTPIPIVQAVTLPTSIICSQTGFLTPIIALSKYLKIKKFGLIEFFKLRKRLKITYIIAVLNYIGLIFKTWLLDAAMNTSIFPKPIDPQIASIHVSVGTILGMLILIYILFFIVYPCMFFNLKYKIKHL